MKGMTLPEGPPTRPLGAGSFQTRCHDLSVQLAASLAGQPEHAFPQAALDALRRSGWWGAGLPRRVGGPGLDACELLGLLQAVGRASLPLGRLFEGHVNALALVSAYADAEQTRRTAQDAQRGHLFGVWNTEAHDGLRLICPPEGSAPLMLQGAKTFASGGLHVTRPLLPAEGPGGRQLVLLRTEDPNTLMREQEGSWQPLGMSATHSVRLDFSGSAVQRGDLIGAPGDYYRQPMFSAGALRFCAVQLGGATTLLAETVGYLHTLGRSGDEVQQLRFAPVWQGLQAASLALAEAERLERACASGQVPQARLLAQVDAVRLATEDACLALLEACERAVGARGLLEPWPFSRLIRDLRMYLRQPAPDAARLRLGRWVLEELNSPDADSSDTDSLDVNGSDADSSDTSDTSVPDAAQRPDSEMQRRASP